MYYFGIDLGGTNVAAAAVDEKGNLLGKASLPTPRGAERVADQMAAAVEAAARAARVTVSGAEAVGVGSPGAIDPENGVVDFWSTLDFEDIPLGKMMNTRLGKQVFLENDANAAALGEYVAGAGKGSRSLVLVTLGTGVGGGAVLNGRLYTGFNHAGLEVGHMVIQHNGRPCTCGRLGCFEAYCSATALIKRTRQVMQEEKDSLLWQAAGDLEHVNGRVPFDAAALGDAAAGRVVDEYIEYLACGLASLVNIFQPEVMCIGGGPSAQGERLLAPVRYILDQEDYARNNVRRTRLMGASLGNDAGLIGAALLPLFR